MLRLGILSLSPRFANSGFSASQKYFTILDFGSNSCEFIPRSRVGDKGLEPLTFPV